MAASPHRDRADDEARRQADEMDAAARGDPITEFRRRLLPAAVAEPML